MLDNAKKSQEIIIVMGNLNIKVGAEGEGEIDGKFRLGTSLFKKHCKHLV